MVLILLETDTALTSEQGTGTWGIVLADGAGVSSGNVTYLIFSTDFNEAGYLAPTTSDEGPIHSHTKMDLVS